MTQLPMQNNPISLYNSQNKTPKHEMNRIVLTLVLLRFTYLPRGLGQIFLDDIFPRNAINIMILV